ncbi:MAG: hypothetical protein IJZ20_03845, partial [Clostridia bacterium]|nr:hypothetical protein [Clostridia bacterium]
FEETLKRYANMTESGATATWEDWILTEKTEGGIFACSSCHAWAAAPIVLVAENLLGFDEGKFNEKTASYIKENFRAKLVTPNGIYNISKKDDRYEFDGK